MTIIDPQKNHGHAAISKHYAKRPVMRYLVLPYYYLVLGDKLWQPFFVRTKIKTADRLINFGPLGQNIATICLSLPSILLDNILSGEHHRSIASYLDQSYRGLELQDRSKPVGLVPNLPKCPHFRGFVFELGKAVF